MTRLDFEEYVRTGQDRLLRTARRLIQDPADAEDLLQTALTNVYRRWDAIEDQSLADAYLRRAMINTRTEWWRSRRLDETPTESVPERAVEDWTRELGIAPGTVKSTLHRALALLRRELVAQERDFGRPSAGRAVGVVPPPDGGGPDGCRIPVRPGSAQSGRMNDNRCAAGSGP